MTGKKEGSIKLNVITVFTRCFDSRKREERAK